MAPRFADTDDDNARASVPLHFPPELVIEVFRHIVSSITYIINDLSEFQGGAYWWSNLEGQDRAVIRVSTSEMPTARA
jgi:hypothetical protein